MVKLVTVLLLSALLLGSVFTVPFAKAQDTDVDEEVQVFDGATDEDARATDAQPEDDDESDDYVEYEEDLPLFAPSPDVTTSVYFPEYPDKNFPLDEEISALIVFSNTGSKTFNISHCVSSLHSPFDLSYYVQNFSSRLLAVIVEPRRQVTVEFKFKPDKALEANEFHLSGYIVYNDTNERVYVSSFVNATVALVDLGAAPIIQTISNFLVLAAFVGLIGYLVVLFRGGKSKGKSAAPRSPRSPTSEGDSSSAASSVPSGFESAVYKQAEKSKAVKRNKDKHKKDKKERKDKPVSAASAGSGSGSEDKQSE